MQRNSDAPVESSPDRIKTLTPRERTCLLAAADGATAKEIALSLGIGYRTVQNYQQEAARKLGVTGTVRAARLLIEAERAAPVDIHPVAAVVADQSIPAAPTLSSFETLSADERQYTSNTNNTQNTTKIMKDAAAAVPELPSGRRVKLSLERVLWLTLAWAVGFGAVLASVAELYRLDL